MTKEISNTDIVTKSKFLISTGMPLVDFKTLLRYMKTNSGNAKEALRRYPQLSRVKSDIEEWIQEMWDTIKPITPKEAFAEEDRVIRRVMFEYIGPTQMMNSIKKEKVHTFQHPHNKDQQYVLWKAEADQLGITQERDSDWREQLYIFAVQMWCPSTDAEHWLWVDQNQQFCQEGNYDAGEAIAWCCQPNTPVENIDYIVRQGESFTVKVKDRNKKCERYPLTKDQYFKLITQET